MNSYSDLESKLVSLIYQLGDSNFDYNSVVKSLDVITQIISLVNSMDLDSQPQQSESELMSLTAQTTSLFNSMDLDSQPKPLRELIAFLSQRFSLVNSKDSKLELKEKQVLGFMSLVDQTLKLEHKPELMSLIHQIFSLVISMNSKSRKLISVCPQVVRLENGKFHHTEEVYWSSNNKWHFLPLYWSMIRLTGEDATYFLCRGCNGENHKEYDKVPVVIKHTLPPKHALQLVWSQHYGRNSERECYCCDEDLNELFYYCSACDLALNLACVEKPPPVFSINHPMWHEHTLTLFPRHTSNTCDLCGLTDSSCPFYICSPCAYVVHQKCLRLPHVITISRHHHSISFTPSFDKGDWSCGVCRKKIDNDYGGYSCSKGCSYAVHSKCATLKNVWDGIGLEGEPNEEGELFMRIGDGIIQHFSHKHPSLRLDENTSRDYDENKICQACIMPIYFGNFYSCMQCEFILHERCALLPRQIRHPLHPHSVTLVGGSDGVVNDENNCSACPWLCTAGFFYECGNALCRFKLHVQCATTSEPFDHESHIHPNLYLTSKQGEERICWVCKLSGNCSTSETFNCIECDFALCFMCATLPQKVRYTDDDHMLTLSYGDETSTRIWCEECEREIDPCRPFYMCGYCCVTLHTECILGADLYMMPGSSWLYYGSKVDVLLNNCHSSRPICSYCNWRCLYKIYIQCSGFIFCSTGCMRKFHR